MKGMKRANLAITLAVAITAAATGTADAGIIILKNGKVFIGRIDPEDVSEEFVTMRGPRLYKGAPAVRGEQKFPKYEIRWFDANSDEPTDEYMKQFENDEIDQRYAVFIQRYRERRENALSVDVPIIPTIRTGSLSAISITERYGQDEISVRKPTGWKSNKTNDILMFESDEKKGDGYAPRIHIFSTEKAIGQPSDQLTWVRQELEKLATSESFETKGDQPSPKIVKNGYDVRWVTATRRGTRTIKAVRKIFFRDHRTYFMTCYAHEKDFEGMLILFDACMASLTITEAGTAGASATEAVDVSNVSVGQTYTWKSATLPDAVVWEVTQKEATTVRHRATTAGADGSKKTTDTSVNTSGVDPVARLSSIAGTQVSPAKVNNAKEVVTVGTVSFDCDVYEAAANGKKYRLWLAKKFPVEVKLMVDGNVERELSAIK